MFRYLGRGLVSFFVISLISFALKGQISVDDFYIAKGGAGYYQNTLIRILDRSSKNVSFAVYQWEHNGEKHTRKRIGKGSLTLDSFSQHFNQAEVSTNAKGQALLHHPQHNRIEYIFDDIGEPLICAPQRKESQEADRTLGELFEAGHNAIDDEERSKRLEEKAQILEKLNDDFNWYSNLMSELGYTEERTPARFQHAPNSREAIKFRIKAMQKLLLRMKEAPQFQATEGEERAHRLFLAITLYGEFGGVQSHLTNPHLFWAARSIDNRVKDQFQVNLNPTFNPHGQLGDFLQDGRTAVVLAPAQYSAWNLSTNNSAPKIDQLLGNPGGPRTNQVLDFVAAYDAGLVQAVGEEPAIDHYVSPLALSSYRSDYPDWWYRMDSIYVSKKPVPSSYQPSWSFWPENRTGQGRRGPPHPTQKTLPGIRRLDGEGEVEHPNPLHFEGAKQ